MTKVFTTQPAGAGVQKSRGGLRLLGLALVPLLLTGGVALAQEEAGSAMEDELEGVEEIVVTTRRRAESLQDVPISVTAFNAEQIEQIKPSTLRDFDGLAPNLYVGMNTAGPSASALYIRGVGYADIEKTQTPQVGVIVDGVQMGSTTGQLIDVFDVESIEVNRGPQGVLFGKNTSGGNIVVNRVRPQFDEFGLKARVALGNHESRQYQARANVPVVEDRMALKLGVNWRDRDGYYDNPELDDTAGDVDYESQTLALRLKATERFDATLTYDRIHDRTQTMPQDVIMDNNPIGGDDRFESLSGKHEPTRYEVDQLGLRIDWDITDRLGLHAITGWHDSIDEVTQDFDGTVTRKHTVMPLAQLHTQRNQTFEVFTQELRFTYDMSDSLDFMLGVYYYDSEVTLQQYTNVVAQLPRAVAAISFEVSPVPATCAEVSVVVRPHPVAGDAICQLPNSRSIQNASEEIEALSFFGALNWRPTEDVEFSIGLRSIDEEKTATNQYINYSNFMFDDGGMDGFDHAGRDFDFSEYTGIVTVPKYTRNDSWDDTIFTASASWQLMESSRLYLNYSEGFRSGGFSIRSAREPSEARFEPEETWQVEVGLKNEFLQRRLRVNLALFHLVVEGEQFAAIIDLPGGSVPGTTTILNNEERTEIQGVELESRWLMTDHLTLVLNGGVIDVTNDPFSIACERVEGVDANGDCDDNYDGENVDPRGTIRMRPGSSDNRQPEWNYSASLFFERQLPGGNLDASLTYKKVGDFLLTSYRGNPPKIYEGGYYGIDARVGYQWQRGDSTWSLAAFGKNLTDEAWKEQALILNGAFASGFQGWGAPRTYSVELTYEF